MLRKLIILALLFAPTAFASKDRGGGDEMGLEFLEVLRSALVEVQSASPDLYKKFEAIEMGKIGENAKVIITEENLVAERDGINQSSVAVNEPSKNLIVINRVRWKMLLNEKLKRAIALHEVASLAGAESTGRYPLSSAYLALSGGSVNNLSANTGKISATLLDSIVNVPEAIKIPASSITVVGEYGSSTADMYVYYSPVPRGKDGQIKQGDGKNLGIVENDKFADIGDEIVLPAGLYRLSYNKTTIFVELARGEKKVIRLAKLAVPKIDGNYKVQVFVDFTNPEEFDKKMKSQWKDGYPELPYGFEHNYTHLNVRQICRGNKDKITFRNERPSTYPFGPRASRACKAWFSGNYKNLGGDVVKASADGSWSLLSFDFDYGMLVVMPRPETAKIFENKGRDLVSGDYMHDGDSVSVFPGTYGIEFTNIAGEKSVELGIKVE